MLNRPDKANVLNIEMLQILKAHIAAAAEEPNLRALILTGAGGARVLFRVRCQRIETTGPYTKRTVG